MKVTRENYELFYLDFLDNKLDPETRIEFMLFLEIHPDLRLEDEQLPCLLADQVSMDSSAKQFIKYGEDLPPTVNAESIERLLLERMEGLLSPEMEIKVKNFIEKDTEAMQLATLYAYTKLSPPQIIYPDKSRLKKTPIRRMYFQWSVAASILLLVCFGWYTTRTTVSMKHSNKSGKLSKVERIQSAHKKTAPPFTANAKSDLVKRNQLMGQYHYTEAKDESIVEMSTQIQQPEIAATHLNLKEDMEVVLADSMIEHVQMYVAENEDTGKEKKSGLTSFSPFSLLTNKIEDVLNRPVRYKRFRENGELTKGFYVRLGNFEISSSKG